ncbi:MAG: uracil-DNA glycosylase [Patescibacteria group bacterium]
MEVKIEKTWKEKLSGEFEKEYFTVLTSFVKKEYQEGVVYPAPKNIFRAFDLCPFEQVKVVILGQDPYHGAHQANGLCFAVDEGVATPPSLQNIFKEIADEYGAIDGHVVSINRGGDLTRWARQGVLLLNATLTVRAHTAGSHQNQGWEQFTDAVIRTLSEERTRLVFMLWGNYARAKGAHIDRTKHLVLESAHPSPFSAASGFFGNGHFKKVNGYLEAHGETPIDWIS